MEADKDPVARQVCTAGTADLPVAEEAAVAANPEAMWEAAGKGDMAVVRKQLKAGVDVDTTD